MPLSSGDLSHTRHSLLLPCSRTSPGYRWLGLGSGAFVRLERGEEESTAFVWLQHSWGLILRFLPPSQEGCRARQTKQRRGNKPAAGLNEEVSGAGDEAGGSRSVVRAGDVPSIQRGREGALRAGSRARSWCRAASFVLKPKLWFPNRPQAHPQSCPLSGQQQVALQGSAPTWVHFSPRAVPGQGAAEVSDTSHTPPLCRAPANAHPGTSAAGGLIFFFPLCKHRSLPTSTV